MNITQTVLAKAKELLDDRPAGLRYSELHAALHEALPNVKLNTIHGCLTIIRTKLQDYNPEKGLYRSPKFTTADEPAVSVDYVVPKAVQVKEHELYEPFSKWLVNELQEATKAIPVGGNKFKDKWGTPDVMGVLQPKPSDIFKFPVEILSAEIKIDSAGLITAFGQACSYKLFSHKSYIVVPSSSQVADISRLDSLCLIFGIGLIVFDSDNGTEPVFRIQTRATPHEPDMFYVNKYVREIADDLLS
jgi:hypothetical protein